ncbi:MAG: twin-arginine translocase TatA/TatE family subunit [Myxococcota bacterium]
MLSLGFWEIVVIGALLLIVVGPERLPKVMRFAGKQYGMLRRAADDMRRAFVLEADRQDADERYQQLQERRAAAQAAREAALAAAGAGTSAQENPLPPPVVPPAAQDVPGGSDVPEPFDVPEVPEGPATAVEPESHEPEEPR